MALCRTEGIVRGVRICADGVRKKGLGGIGTGVIIRARLFGVNKKCPTSFHQWSTII
jgi:hypothetical protein